MFFFLPDDPQSHGFLLDSVVQRMPWTPDFRLTANPRKEVYLIKQDLKKHVRERLMKSSISPARRTSSPGWGRSAMNNFQLWAPVSILASKGLRARCRHRRKRGTYDCLYTYELGNQLLDPAKKPTWLNMLDNAVAGGVARGEMRFQCLVREAGEEAGLSEEVLRRATVAVGTVTWFNISDEKAGGELGLMNPGVLYLYDLEVGEDVVFEPVDNDVQSFHLLNGEEVEDATRKAEFKLSCATVMIDFFVRYGFITAENEKDYTEIVSRLHRKLPFETSPGF